MTDSIDSITTTTMADQRKTFVDTYRTALALNNVSVSLLHNGCPQEALKTSSDALSILQKTLKSNHSADGTARAQKAAEKHQQVLCQATQQQPQQQDPPPQDDKTTEARCRTQASSQKKSRMSFFCSGLEVNELDDDDISSAKYIARYGPSTTIFFPIRICESLSVDDQDDIIQQSEIARHLGIILYNNGLLRYIVAIHHESKETEKAALLSDSIKSLSFASRAFFRGMENTNNADKDVVRYSAASFLDLQMDDIPCLLLSIITLNCLSQVFRTVRKGQKAENAQQSASDLLAAFLVHEEKSRHVVEMRGTAAAA
mmetsp:Transcript_16058/g.44198  ORF Transcript_16058/g.44198 Transcript_16058/m.44198 type:complete len:315 (-) Transcript_16058:64-1008(-)